MSNSTVATSAVRALITFAASKGAQADELVSRAGLRMSAMEDGTARVPLTTYEALMHLAQEQCGDPALALHFGEAVTLSEVSFVALMGETPGTMASSLAHWNTYSRLIVDVEGAEGGERFVLRDAGADLWILDTRRNPNAFPELTESTFARMVTASRQLLRGRTFLKSVCVTHPAPTYRAEYERIFAVPVEFSARHNALVTDPSWTTHQTSGAPPLVSEVLRAHADALLDRLDRERTTRGRVERLLTTLLPTGEVSIERVAHQLALSRQTLFRRLRDEGVTFERILDELRHSLAMDYLGIQGETVRRTAALLGFSDPAAFSRAFKRWTGASPTSWRSRSS